MTFHSVVDESKDPSYLLVAALVRPAHLASMRKVIRAMVLPGQRRIHFHKERDARKAQILDLLLELPIESVIYQCMGKTDEKTARIGCLTRLVEDHVTRDVRRLVLERDDSVEDFDRHFLRHEVQKWGATDNLTYEHMRAFEEPLLSIPDAVAWCWSRGDHWRVKAKQLVVEVNQI